jgi:hypothetical protein
MPSGGRKGAPLDAPQLKNGGTQKKSPLWTGAGIFLYGSADGNCRFKLHREDLLH